MQPPGSPEPLSTPLGAKTPGAGQVVSSGAMESSIRNGSLKKWLSNAGEALVQRVDSGGEVRLTSFWSRHWYGAPAWSTWRVCARSASRRPSTCSQPP